MFRFVSKFIILCTLALVVGNFAFGLTENNVPVKLEYKLKEGDKLNYRITIEGETTTLAQDNKTYSSSFQSYYSVIQEVSDMDDKGTITISHFYEAGFDEKDNIITRSPLMHKKMLVKMLKNGQITGIDDEEIRGKGITQSGYKNDKIIEQLSGFFPDTAIKKGDFWEQKLKIADFGLQDEPVVAKSKNILLGFESIKGYDCAKISSKYSYPVSYKTVHESHNKPVIVKGKKEFDTIIYFAHEEGIMVGTVTDITVVLMQFLAAEDEKMSQLHMAVAESKAPLIKRIDLKMKKISELLVP